MTSFFVRDSLGDTPGHRIGVFSASPDIILAGLEPVDPSRFTTAAGYATDFGGNAILNQANFVYLRALSTGAPPANGRAWLYHTDSALALWPSNWRSDGIEVAGNAVNYQPVSATAQDQVCVADLPFVWTPAPLPGGDHYCMISWFEDDPSEPPTSPVADIGNFTSFDELITFVLDHPQMGWRNVIDVAQMGPTWSQTSNITGPTPAERFIVGVQGSNMPTDGAFSFAIPGPAPGIPPIIVPAGGGLQPIPSPNFQTSVAVTDWPAGAQTSMTLNYEQGATAPPSGASLTAFLSVPVSETEPGVADRIRTERPDLLKRTPIADESENENSFQEMIVVGAVTYIF